ncbi:hypothetical protein ACIGZJ_31155 [Kitasatospora sp. NPDC052868]|uniref:RapZ C-terminal domain-containing protein n=1 Tax=Kitasatospora sp. NPDC052868 TaxID=3364060 RepID=UPI0037C78561
MTEQQTHRENGGLVQVVIHSIGTLHGDALDIVAGHSGLFFNVGGPEFRNPHDDPGMRFRTGLDEEVRDHVLGTPGMMPMVERIAESAKAVLFSYANRRRDLVHVVVACRGGRHRSVAAAESAAEYLKIDDIAVDVEHHHITRPVVQA